MIKNPVGHRSEKCCGRKKKGLRTVSRGQEHVEVEDVDRNHCGSSSSQASQEGKTAGTSTAEPADTWALTSSVPGVSHNILASSNPSVSATPVAAGSAQDSCNPGNIMRR